MRWLVLALLVGCTPSPEQEVDDVCNAFCDCLETIPTLITQCVTQCKQQLPTVTTACGSCVDSFEATCTGLVDTCSNDCFAATPDTKGSR
jgi:hypothetical protein